ncbi:MAG: GspE/PulE family protein [Verrucomicrobia bacterium]|nr:GspE/PulE family protein [Verrucomicrobiota bacterium]
MATELIGAPKPVLYNLKELRKNAEYERENNVIGKERIDRLEIEQLFKNKLKKRAIQTKEKKPFEELINIVDPAIPEEHRIIIKEYLDADSLRGVEDAVLKGLIGKRQAGELWANKIGVAYLDPIQSVITDDALSLIPEEIARKAGVLPLYLLNNVLTISTSNPRNEELNRRLKFISGHNISPIFAFPSEIKDAIEIHYASEEDVSTIIKRFQEQNKGVLEDLDELEIGHLAESEMLANIVDSIMHFGIKEGASDIHIEPMETKCRVRFRIDGRLREILSFNKSIHPAMASRIKILCKLDISEKRFPQDGRFEMPLGMVKAEFRVSFIPASYGSKIVIRILGSTGQKGAMTLDDMLVSGIVLKPWRRLIRSPNGIVFVTGPTGSGKTTTLYASLQELNSPEVNISTIEDPIEISLDGLTQSQVNHSIALGFPDLLRSLLRQDPDIILVGEIRDLETAKIATEAALTGHLVFATLHTNNAVQAVTRLVEIGIEPYMVAPSITAVLAQRLCARLDDANKEAYIPSEELLSGIFENPEFAKDLLLYRPTPNVTGTPQAYKGRVAIHELVTVTDEIRALISNRASAEELAVAAYKIGYRTLRFDALKKALLGLTSIDEVERITPQEFRS